MESKRQHKMASLLQQELAAVLQRDLPHLFGGGLAPGISEVRVSPDLGVARVYLSLLLAQDAGSRLAAVRENTKLIRGALGKRIGRQVRVVPELTFFHDDSAAYAARIDEVLGGLHIPPADDSAAGTDDSETPSRPKLFNKE